MTRNNRGFTLIEVVVVAGIIAILAGILVPMIFSQIDEAKKTRAVSEAKSISSAILAFYKDVGKWPALDGTTGAYSSAILITEGNPQASLPVTWTGYLSGASDNIKNQLSGEALASPIYSSIARGAAADGLYGKMWKGPYISTPQADPWGNAYYINIWGLYMPDASADSVWVVSPGPDGVLETLPTSDKLQGDDIGIRMR